MKICIFDYMDIRLFLQDFYQFRKTAEPSFSYSVWAQELGFHNKTLLRLILQGKRQISPKSRQQFKSALQLDEKETAYFDALIDYTQAKSASQRQSMGQRLIQIQRQNFSFTQVPVETGVLQDAFGPLILTVIDSAEHPLRQEEIIAKLSLSPEKLQKILNLFLQNNLIEEKDGFLKAKQSTFKIPDHIGHQDLANFYKHWLPRSAEAIDLPVELRRFRSLQILLSETEFQEIVEAFNEFVLSILARVEKNTLSLRRLYLFNTAIFPVTDKWPPATPEKRTSAKVLGDGW